MVPRYYNTYKRSLNIFCICFNNKLFEIKPMADQRVRQLKIKTGVVKRYLRALFSNK